MKRLLGVLGFIALSGCTLWHGPDAYLPSKNGIVAGETITVGSNENIYGIAREHNVSMRELIVINDLKPPFEVKPGQTLTLPATGATFAGNMPPPTSAPLEPVEKNALPPIEPAAVSSQSLEPVPEAPPSQPPPAETNLGRGSLQQLSPPAPSPAVQPQATVQSREPVQALNQPKPLPKSVATTIDSGGDGGGSVSMSWPLQGPILSGFGAKGPGLSNDGVNIGAPKGAPVAAAAAGTVVYAGDEMKGFGNLVLIRHSDDWVTAYAHLDRVLVKKDSVVGQGDMIGTVGKTGNVTSPQLHFETRHNGKPVDPESVIKNAL